MHRSRAMCLLGFTAVDVGLMEGHSHVRPGVVSTDVPAHAAQIRQRLDDRGLQLADLLFLPSSDMRTLAVMIPTPTCEASPRPCSMPCSIWLVSSALPA